jgi:hypothetical protein
MTGENQFPIDKDVRTQLSTTAVLTKRKAPWQFVNPIESQVCGKAGGPPSAQNKTSREKLELRSS